MQNQRSFTQLLQTSPDTQPHIIYIMGTHIEIHTKLRNAYRIAFYTHPNILNMYRNSTTQKTTYLPIVPRIRHADQSHPYTKKNASACLINIKLPNNQ